MTYQGKVRSTEIPSIKPHQPVLTYDFFRFLQRPEQTKKPAEAGADYTHYTNANVNVKTRQS